MNTILTLLSHARLQQFYREGHWQDRTIYGYVSATAASAPDAYAVRDSLSRITYRELLAAADAFAAELTARGLRAGDRVAVWLPSRVEVVVALVACSRNGFVCCPSLHRDHTVSAIMELLERMRASAIVYQPGYGADADRHDFVAALAGLSSLRHCFELPPGARLAREPAGHSADTPNDDPNRVVYLPFTSGTTGEPKGVMHSDNTLLANARALNADWHIGSSSVIYSLSPLSHNLGVGSTVMAFAAGAELVIHDLPRGASLVARLRETGATFLVGVPTHAFDFLKELRALPPQPLALKGFRISGAPASTEVVAGLLEYGIMPQSGYGMTEAGSHNYTHPDDDPRLVLETSGRACRGYELRIFKQDDPETEADPGEMGQIAGRGASLMLGYFGAQETTERAFNASGWFLTGDVGWIDERGYVRVTGRKKDLIIRGGHNIYPAQIEALATRHDAVEKAVAIPVADERLGEKVCIAVVLRAGSDLDPEELLVHLDAEGLSKYEMPEYFLHLSELPLTASGKIRKMELVERVRDGSLVPVPVRWRASVS
jgi:acyl-CoA synthetase (AMP-forming)/AMP-acid ligase II